VFAVALALLASHPDIVLVAVAYLYLLSGFIGLILQRSQRRAAELEAAPEAPEPPAAPEPAPEPEDRRPEMPQLPDLRS
jgi:hypothetical protein